MAPVAVTTAAVARWTSRSQASITHPVNSHTSYPVLRSAGGRRHGRRGSPARRGTSRSRWAAARSVEPASSNRWWPSTREAGALPPGGGAVGVGERGASALHQPPERDPAGARRLATPALHARLHEPHELAVGVGAAPLDGAHGVDPAPRRQALLAGSPERRAVRQAQPARHARRQLVVVEAELDEAAGHQRAVRTRGPVSVTATVCSAWAARLPSRVRTVHPSSPWR